MQMKITWKKQNNLMNQVFISLSIKLLNKTTMVKLTVLLNKGHLECNLTGIEIYHEKYMALLLTDHKGLIHALEYLFKGLVKEKHTLPWLDPVELMLSDRQLIVLNLSILSIFAIKYKGKEPSHLVIASKEWLHNRGEDAIEEMNNILSPPISPDFELMDMPVCGGCPSDIDCKNCPIFT